MNLRRCLSKRYRAARASSSGDRIVLRLLMDCSGRSRARRQTWATPGARRGCVPGTGQGQELVIGADIWPEVSQGAEELQSLAPFIFQFSIFNVQYISIRGELCRLLKLLQMQIEKCKLKNDEPARTVVYISPARFCRRRSRGGDAGNLTARRGQCDRWELHSCRC